MQVLADPDLQGHEYHSRVQSPKTERHLKDFEIRPVVVHPTSEHLSRHGYGRRNSRTRLRVILARRRDALVVQRTER